VLAPAAEDVDRAPVVPRSHLAALAEAGLFDAGGAREVYEILAGACGATFFVWVQHHAPVRLLRASPNVGLADRWLPRLRSGAVLGGVAFAHLRRPGPPAVTARPVDGGYALYGEAPWVTSWGLAEVFAVAARCGDRVVYVLVPAGAAGLRPSPPLALLAMQATSTVRIGFDGFTAPEADVILDLPFDRWLAADRAATARPNPAAFGVAGTCARLLRDLEPAAAAALEAERLECRARSYGGEPDQVGLRAWSLELAVRSALALVAATGGRSMQASHPAQRLLREAAFYCIQAQTPALRSATLSRLARP